MRKAFKGIFYLLIPFTILSCKTPEIVSEKNNIQTSVVQKDSADTDSENEEVFYYLDQSDFRGSALRSFDLLHTRLELEPDWATSQLKGKATLQLTPYFYPQSTIEIDAEGFDIRSVKLVRVEEKEALSYEYDSLTLLVSLDRQYKKDDILTLELDYVAKPEELPLLLGEAIQSDKGLFFIDPLDTIPEKPTQLWTQGQPQSASRWFPTLDSPNERCTQELLIKVDTAFETLSNGVLVSSLIDNEGKRTDHWKLDRPHPPYLFSLVVGDFSIVEDRSGDIPLYYYVEFEYEKYAKDIFGRTPEMITHFEDLLGVKYPWPKYAQVPVRDYVSGAMENTTASTFMEQLQMDSRELIDADWDAIIAHELFHQWFGDYVTCESWSYLTLNEAFATYAEFLWKEKAESINSAQLWRMEQLQQYFNETEEKKVPIIRYEYEEEDDLFDSHTYAKGGLILHMLRSYVGDEAFFKALNAYLRNNKLSSVELSDLRQSFEDVTGEDLNWYFNQWFLSPGHPVLEVEHSYDSGVLEIQIEQVQNKSESPLYILPFHLDIWQGGELFRYPVKMENELEEFEIELKAKPDLIIIDGDYQLVGEIRHPKTDSELKFQYENSDNLQARHEALDIFSENPTDSTSKMVLSRALEDNFWSIREQAALSFYEYPEEIEPETFSKILRLLEDAKSDVRAAAVEVIASNNPPEELTRKIEKMISDSSYYVASTALSTSLRSGSEKVDSLINTFENSENPDFILAISEYYAENRIDGKHQWFYKRLDELSDVYLWSILLNFNELNLFANEDLQKTSIDVLKSLATSHELYYVRLAAFQGLIPLDKFEGVEQLLNDIKADEADEELREIYNSLY